jgi:hypothetical protein
MPSENKRTPSPRRYPAFWEKAVPLIVGIIVLAIVVLLIVIVAVALGLFPAA